MAVMNYSKKREAIKTYLMSTDTHPTADDVYSHVKHIFPNMSLATVYRNLNQMVETGDVIKVTNLNGKDHFDWDTTPHDHVACNSCGRVEDLLLPPEYADQIQQMVQSVYNGRIDQSRRLFYGCCETCMNKQM